MYKAILTGLGGQGLNWVRQVRQRTDVEAVAYVEPFAPNRERRRCKGSLAHPMSPYEPPEAASACRSSARCGLRLARFGRMEPEHKRGSSPAASARDLHAPPPLDPRLQLGTGGGMLLEPFHPLRGCGRTGPARVTIVHAL